MLQSDEIAEATGAQQSQYTVSAGSLRSLDWLNFFKADRSKQLDQSTVCALIESRARVKLKA